MARFNEKDIARILNRVEPEEALEGIQLSTAYRGIIENLERDITDTLGSLFYDGISEVFAIGFARRFKLIFATLLRDMMMPIKVGDQEVVLNFGPFRNWLESLAEDLSESDKIKHWKGLYKDAEKALVEKELEIERLSAKIKTLKMEVEEKEKELEEKEERIKLLSTLPNRIKKRIDYGYSIANRDYLKRKTSYNLGRRAAWGFMKSWIHNLY